MNPLKLFVKHSPIEGKVSRYLLTITLINSASSALGCSIAVVLTLLGLEYEYIWGIVAFLLNFVPYAEGLLETALVRAYTIVFFDSVTYALAAPAAYLALTTIKGQFLTATLVGKRLEMNSSLCFSQWCCGAGSGAYRVPWSPFYSLWYSK